MMEPGTCTCVAEVLPHQVKFEMSSSFCLSVLGSGRAGPGGQPRGRWRHEGGGGRPEQQQQPPEGQGREEVVEQVVLA